MLNKSKGNMYQFINATWNTVKGKCYHDCKFCYMKRWGELKPVRFDEKELKTDLGENNFIFVGSSCDMFAEDIPEDWIRTTINKCKGYNNRYLFQSKNPKNFMGYIYPRNTILCTTIESNRYYPNILNNAPLIKDRVNDFLLLSDKLFKKMVTIEPILDFDIEEFLRMLESINPIQINIGADSGNNNLPEPPKEKVLELIQELEKFTKVYIKDNLRRLIK